MELQILYFMDKILYTENLHEKLHEIRNNYLH